MQRKALKCFLYPSTTNGLAVLADKVLKILTRLDIDSPTIHNFAEYTQALSYLSLFVNLTK
jgi:hypothetical protein